MRDEPSPHTRHLRVYGYRGHTVLEFRGEIDIAAAAEIAPVLDRVTRHTGARVVIDLRLVEFFDCSGLRLLYRARARVLEHGGRLHLVCTHPLTLRVFRVTGLARLLPPHPTPDAALAQDSTVSGRAAAPRTGP
ncbi:anti-anti-sigma factor [Streptomyces pluripotens]|uniref:Anti-sigma factor antagonist n=1 Tax=Streptomyces pluripotens TaxID=1355015 RepID=A0A221P7R7_9ACTN|nr:MULTISPECIES: anti-sigma factor antagonist [Streptomyces]ARP73886.1 anti-anti-sigma factor [Streptomyces pluripotens]ASN28146.1 anti-anti-sigma factor [Streptomyces pluripotens]KIE27885.1 anti-sigma factor antagonist [Streptomyces sp. MUSC 125]MCH0558475.1 anti-sigma factor antagonist [Streptomyces sp. MUM 16J]